MASNVIPLETGTFKLSAMEFHSAPSDEHAPTIKLGYIGEIVLPNMLSLGLIARTALSEHEMDLVGELGRRTLSDPYDFLSEEFDAAWEKGERGRAIEFLCARHQHSLRVALPNLKTLPRNLFSDGRPIRSLMLQYLVGKLEDVAYDLRPFREDSVAPTRVLLAA